MVKWQAVIDFLTPYCKQHAIPIERAENQLCAIGKDIAILCVANPEAPKADSLANDIDTQMLPTLYVHINGSKMTIEETEYTHRYLIDGFQFEEMEKQALEDP